ncbi:hypothetical protein E2562_002024 [Oryza meyeriana var. granulata]|uniref:Uncharacterized protein n=1 Tax=Oryza meyeriana var. granulata TaxID=110450 RepID=A0A6G1C446_9ORYZ|nr:hypothetical protein E2562_002024 [Oryza meyeriana var. granulata]
MSKQRGRERKGGGARGSVLGGYFSKETRLVGGWRRWWFSKAVLVGRSRGRELEARRLSPTHFFWCATNKMVYMDSLLSELWEKLRAGLFSGGNDSLGA